MKASDLNLPFEIVTPVGSRVTCDPAPMDTDRDWLVLIPADTLHKVDALMHGLGWVLGGSDVVDENHPVNPHEEFCSFTKGVDNVILTESAIFYDRFMAATSVAKRLNLLKKEDRIALFQAVLYARSAA